MKHKYIDSEKLLAELRRQKHELKLSIQSQGDYGQSCQIVAYENICNLITSIQQEQPEVDLDDVVENYILENFGERWDGCVPVSCFELDLMAEHFYKLGLNARNEG